jgi:hypothetical protein
MVCSEQTDARMAWCYAGVGGMEAGVSLRSSLIGRFVFEDKTTRKSVGTLPAKENEGIVVAVHRPRSRRHLTKFDEPPVTGVFAPKAKVVPDGRRHIEAGTLIQIRSWTFVAKHILPVIGTEGAAILPLGITNSISVSNGEPSTLEYGLAITDKRLLEPGDYLASFGFCSPSFDIVVRESHIKRILPRDKIDRNEISSGTDLGSIIASVAIVPIPVPGAAIVGDRVIAAGALTNPKNGGDNPELP